MISLSEQTNAGCSQALAVAIISKRGKKVFSRQEKFTGEFEIPKRALLAIPQLVGETVPDFFQRVMNICRKHGLKNVKGIDHM